MGHDALSSHWIPIPCGRTPLAWNVCSLEATCPTPTSPPLQTIHILFSGTRCENTVVLPVHIPNAAASVSGVPKREKSVTNSVFAPPERASRPGLWLHNLVPLPNTSHCTSSYPNADARPSLLAQLLRFIYGKRWTTLHKKRYIGRASEG